MQSEPFHEAGFTHNFHTKHSPLIQMPRLTVCPECVSVTEFPPRPNDFPMSPLLFLAQPTSVRNVLSSHFQMQLIRQPSHAGKDILPTNLLCMIMGVKKLDKPGLLVFHFILFSFLHWL